MPPTRGSSRSAPRPAAGGSSRGRRAATRSAPRTCTRVDDVVDALLDLHAAAPRRAGRRWSSSTRASSGSGNALVDLAGPARGRDAATERARRRRERVAAMQLEDTRSHVDAYLAKLDERGGIVEERIVGDEVRSPSVQLRVTPLGELEILSTHDQILGGPDGPVLPRRALPRRPGLRAADHRRRRRRSGESSPSKGVARALRPRLRRRPRAGRQWEADAIEINLRKGGTTHPFLTLQFLTDGATTRARARFLTPGGEERHLVATDHLEDRALRGLRVDDLFDLVARAGLHFDQSRQAGVVFHMISSITECGRVGMTAIGDTPDSAQEVYDRAERPCSPRPGRRRPLRRCLPDRALRARVPRRGAAPR